MDLTAVAAPWRFEDGGPRRSQAVPGSLLLGPASALTVTTRMAPATTMVVGSGPQHLYLLRHTGGADAVSFVERIDPYTLEPVNESPALAGGPPWPGGIGVYDDGSVYVVFGNHAHRLSPELQVTASTRLPRDRPYNSFVPLPDGHLVTKDFAGSRPGVPVAEAEREPAELCVLDPDLKIVDRLQLPEPSIARLSADADNVYIVGDRSLLCATWDGSRLHRDDDFAATYRTLDGQSYGWDCVIAAGFAWFLDNGDGSEAFSGTLRGHGLATAPLHLIRVDLGTGEVAMAEVCGLEKGLIANPPVVDPHHRVAVGYDSGNGVVTGFDLDSLETRWQRQQDHGAHLLLYEESGELVTGDHADVVVLDVSSGAELARVDTGSGLQSVLFPSPGFERDFYLCSLLTVSRVVVSD